MKEEQTKFGIPILYLGVIALVSMMILGGVSYSVSKVALGSFRPNELIFYRFLLGALTLALISPKSLFSLTFEKFKLVFPTSTMLAISMITLWQGASTSSTGIAAFLVNSEFILIPIISLVIYREVISFHTALLVVLGLIGMALLSFEDGFQISRATGILLVSATCFAFYAIMNTALTKKVELIELTILNTSITAFFCLIAALYEGFSLNFSLDSIPILFFLGPCLTGIRFYFLAFGQSQLKPAHTGLLYLSEPITAALIGYYSLGEIFSQKQLLGIGVLILTVFLSFKVISEEEGKEA